MTNISKSSFHPFLFEFSRLFLLYELWDLLAFKAIRNFLTEGLNSPTEKVDIFKPFFSKIGSIFYSFLLIEVVNDYDLFVLVLVVIHLRQELISIDIRSRKTEGLFNVVLLVFIGFSQVEEQEFSFDSNWKLLCFDSDRG